MIEDNNYGDDLLHKIKDNKMQPKPRWQFLVKNYIIWILGIFSLIFGAIATSLIFYMLKNNDIAAYERAGSQPLEKIFFIIPFFWVICLALFVFIVLYDIKHTKRGYRYSALAIVSVMAVSSLVLGGIFHALNFGEKIDNILGRNAPFYDRIINPRVDFWSQPEKGRLTGVLESKISTDEYLLIDRNRKEWKVTASGLKKDDNIELDINRPARFIGTKKSDNEFIATELLPMMPPGQEFFNRFGPPGPHGPFGQDRNMMGAPDRNSNPPMEIK